MVCCQKFLTYVRYKFKNKKIPASKLVTGIPTYVLS